MAPKRGTKRKITPPNSTDDNTNGTNPQPPDRENWPGWVEMESEPAFFNVMLKEMGVKGAKVQEVYSLDDDMLAILPQPVHALIFLFRYRATDTEQQEADSCAKHVWFANQIPDFACASYALLNIVNNIPGLDLGRELLKFKEFTKDMDALTRGDAVDGFQFVRHIHNSFAREIDLLQADQYTKNKAAKAKKRQALAKARETRAANKVAKAKPVLKETSANISATPVRSSRRERKTPQKLQPSYPAPTEKSNVTEEKSSQKKKKKPKKGIDSESQSPEDRSDDEFHAPRKGEDESQPQNLRRSKRAPKPRQPTVSAQSEVADDDVGFHFIAYMPIQDHVWKLDGLDRHPQDMGAIAEGMNWMHIVQPTLMGRMAQYEGADIEFNLMAVVHDPINADKKALAENAKAIQAFDARLEVVYEDWREMEGADTKAEVVVKSSLDLAITPAEVDAATASATAVEGIDEEEDLLKLIERRGRVIKQQAGLRAVVRDALESEKADDEKARHRRHDYRTFIRSWFGVLAEEEVLADLLEE